MTKDPIKNREAVKKWRKLYPEKVRVYQRKWRLINIEKERERVRKWREENPDKIKECNRKYKEAHREQMKLWNKEWSLRNPDCRRSLKIKRNFGLTLWEYYLLLEKQNFKCAICGKDKEKNGRFLAIDHDHKTGKIRGLLCSNCNTGIGFLQDSIDILTKSINYLR